MSDRMQEEFKTISKMVCVYCRGKHETRSGLCAQCQGLLDYASQKLSHCAFAPDKPVCAKCPVHCYRAEHREMVREVMRYAGPRMLLVDPVAAVKHLVALRRKPSPAVQRIIDQKAAREHAPG